MSQQTRWKEGKKNVKNKSMNTKHTPAPWKIFRQDEDLIIINESSRPSIADITGGNGLEEDEANAKLIAAAPELLEALKQIEQFSDCGDDFIAVCKMKSIATEAIKKATL